MITHTGKISQSSLMTVPTTTMANGKPSPITNSSNGTSGSTLKDQPRNHQSFHHSARPSLTMVLTPMATSRQSPNKATTPNARKPLKTLDPGRLANGNNTTMSRIVAAVPGRQLYLIKPSKYAKQAWEILCSTYQPQNSLRAATIKGQIMSYRCQSDMNVAKWLNDMQCQYSSLCDLDTTCMTDHDFALAILDLMPQDNSWRNFVSDLCTKVQNLESEQRPIDSSTFVIAICNEHWYRHKDDFQTNSQIFSARIDAQKRAALKRSRPTDLVASATSPPSTTKCTHVNPKKAHLKCTNSFCGSQKGHDTADCIAYKGAKQGQYSPWWRGPWNIHLPESQCSKENNIPPKTHPASTRLSTPTVNQSQSSDITADRSTTTPIHSEDHATQANLTASSETDFHAWSTHLDNNTVLATLPVLNNSLPRDNSCHHDSGANRHVFHDRCTFEEYKTIPPLTVKGFGQNLSAIAIGRGTVRLKAWHNNQKHIILLKDALHIPTARSNLISGIQLDKAGVISTLGNNSISLSVKGKILVISSVINDMYHLNLNIVPQRPASLISRLSPPGPPSLQSRIEPNACSMQTLDFYIA
jgi:hypothetical protein